MNKTAKELFKELGYSETENDKAVLVYSMKQYPYHKVIFYKKDKWLITTDDKDYGVDITMSLLEAINKQVEELRWKNE